MVGILLLSLPLTLLMVGIVLVWAFVDAAWQVAPAHQMALPFRRKPVDALLAETAAAIERLSGESPEAWLTCPETPYVPRVTEAEAAAIAADIQNRGRVEVRRVLEIANSHQECCPMRLADGLCACATIRPLECLGRCRAGTDAPAWDAEFSQSVSTAFQQHLRHQHQDAGTRRLDEAMVELLSARPI